MILHTLRHFVGAKLRWQLLQAERLEEYQNESAQRMVQWVAQHSPFYRRHWEGHDLRDWKKLPPIGKAEMMAHFAEFNTLGIGKEQALQTARRAESERNFNPTLSGATVGLSSGTSGQRGLFVVSPQEQAAWSGVILSRLLHRFDPGGERVAFFLRANSNLYESVRRGRWLQFKYLDLLLPRAEILDRLNRFQPTIVVAPPSMLGSLAKALHTRELRIRPRQVVSVAEVLEAQDQRRLEAAFQLPVHQVYQATEGLLAITCGRGHLHIQEDLVVMQMEEVEGGGRQTSKGDPSRFPLTSKRFTPIITDLWRRAQPIVRYRLGDVLRVRVGRCECGSSWRVIEGHEGRMGDILRFEGGSLFLSDVGHVMEQSPVVFEDYRLEQDAPGQLRVMVDGCDDLSGLRGYLEQALAGLGLRAEGLEVLPGIPEQPANLKRRRVRGPG